VKLAMRCSSENYFKYDPFKHGNGKKTIMPASYVSPLVQRKKKFAGEVREMRAATIHKY
jgi:hypothetical protein